MEYPSEYSRQKETKALEKELNRIEDSIGTEEQNRFRNVHDNDLVAWYSLYIAGDDPLVDHIKLIPGSFREWLMKKKMKWKRIIAHDHEERVDTIVDRTEEQMVIDEESKRFENVHDCDLVSWYCIYLSEEESSADRIKLTPGLFDEWLVYKKTTWNRKDFTNTAGIPEVPEIISTCSRTATVNDVLSILWESTVYLSMRAGLSALNKSILTSSNIWFSLLTKQRNNVDLCLCDRASQFSHRNKKLVLLDLSACKDFMVHSSRFTGNQNFWKSVLYELCMEFIHIARNIDYAPKSVMSISNTIDTAFLSDSWNDSVLGMSEQGQETLYYISGWTICAVNKLIPRRKEDFGSVLRYFHNNCQISSTEAKSKLLPTSKVDRVMVFGSLVYTSVDYFHFICMIESVFVFSLSHDNLIVHGSMLISKIQNLLVNNKKVLSVITGLLPIPTDFRLINEIVNYLVLIYCRMRGKDFCFKMLSKGSALKVTTRQAQAVISSAEFHAASRKKGKCKKEKIDKADHEDHTKCSEVFTAIVNKLM